MVECVTRIGFSDECRNRGLLIGAAACHRTRSLGIHISRDRVIVRTHLVEHGYVISSGRHRDLTRVVVVAVAPACEVKAHIRRGGQSGRLAIVVIAAAAHRAAIAGTGIHLNGVFFHIVVSGIGDILGHRHRTRIVSVAIVPVAEHIASIADGRQCDRRAFLIGAAARHASRPRWVDRSINGIIINRCLAKEGRVSGSLCHRKAVVGVGANDGTVFLPIEELVAASRCGGKRTGLPRIESAAARRRTPCVVVGIDRDGILGVHFGDTDIVDGPVVTMVAFIYKGNTNIMAGVTC